MAFVPIAKTKSYFKRFQTKFRRRREGKTNYKARQRLVTQAKTKFNAPKYRLVARITNKDVVAQVVDAKIVGDMVICAAYAHELPRYGIKVGLTNYAACYATGLLLARRLLKKLGIDQKFVGAKSVDGSMFLVDEVDGQRPFKAALDVGLARTTTGARVFGVMKGAVDGGLYVPHSESRFPGYDREESKFDAAVHRDRIFGKHVAEYMRSLSEEDPEAYQRQFGKYIKAGVKADDVEAMYKKAHAAIRADPSFTKKASTGKKTARKFNKGKLSLGDRKIRAAQKKARIEAAFNRLYAAE